MAAVEKGEVGLGLEAAKETEACGAAREACAEVSSASFVHGRCWLFVVQAQGGRLQRSTARRRTWEAEVRVAEACKLGRRGIHS